MTTAQAVITKPCYVPKVKTAYTFAAIDVIKVKNAYPGDINELCPNYYSNMCEVPAKHVDRIIYEVARHIEGSFGCVYQATLFYDERSSILWILTPKGDKWWKPVHWKSLNDYLIGLRSLMDILA